MSELSQRIFSWRAADQRARSAQAALALAMLDFLEGKGSEPVAEKVAAARRFRSAAEEQLAQVLACKARTDDLAMHPEDDNLSQQAVNVRALFMTRSAASAISRKLLPRGQPETSHRADAIRPPQRARQQDEYPQQLRTP